MTFTPSDLTACLLALGQEKAAQPPGQPAEGAPPAAPGGGAGDGAGGGFGSSMFFPLILIVIVFYLLIFLPESRKRKARLQMIRNVKKGDQVVTAAGILGKVMKVDDREVILQVDRDNDVRMRFLKSAIQDVVPEGGPVDAKDASGASKESGS